MLTMKIKHILIILAILLVFAIVVMICIPEKELQQDSANQITLDHRIIYPSENETTTSQNNITSQKTQNETKGSIWDKIGIDPDDVYELKPSKDSDKDIIIEGFECAHLGCPALTYYVGDNSSKIYYKCDCYLAEKISKENLVCLQDKTIAEALGYSECAACRS